MPATSDTTDFSYATPASPDTADLTGATSSNSQGSLFSATSSGLQTLDIVLTNILSDNKKIAFEPYNNQFTLSDGTTGYSALHYATKLETLGLDALGDVTITNIADNQLLSYDNSTSKFVNAKLAFDNIATGVVLDNDDMANASATTLATSESIKAYVDAQNTAQDLDFQGNAGGAQSVTLGNQLLTLTGGTGIDTTGSAQTMTFAIDSTVVQKDATQTLTAKTLTTPVINGFSGTGNASINGTFTVGVDDTGYDVKFFGATSGKYMEWDESADQLDVTGSFDVTGDSSFDGDVTFTGALYDAVWDKSANTFRIKDNAFLAAGTSDDLLFYHSSLGGTSNSFINNQTGDLTIVNNADDKDLILKTDNGSGNTTAYITLDGSEGEVILGHYNSTKLTTKSTGIEVTGTVIDDGATHDGDVTFTGANYNIVWDKSDNRLEVADEAKISFGASNDLELWHTASGSNSLINAFNGDLYIQSLTADKDILIRADDSSGSVVDYLRIDGSTGEVKLSHYGSEKLVTKSTGVNITGVLTTTGNIELGHASDNTLSASSGVLSIEGKSIVDTGGTGLTKSSSSSSTLNLDTNSLTEAAIADGDYIVFNDATDSNAPKKEALADVATLFAGTGLSASSSVLSVDISGTTNEVEVGQNGNTITVGLPNNVTIAGNLTVNGTTTTVDTDNLTVKDSLISLARNNNGSDSLDIGFYGLYDTSGSQDLYAGLFRDANDNGKFKLFKDLQDAPGDGVVDTGGVGYTVGTLVANLEGDVTGNASGSAATVTGANQSAITSLGNLTGLTVNGDVTFTGDNYNAVWDKSDNALEFADQAKLDFGAGDFKIYHYANSFIKNYSGGLYIDQESNDVDIRLRADDGFGGLVDYFKADGSEGEALLYHYGSQKLATKSTGVDVTGTITADGLTVDGDATFTGDSYDVVWDKSDNKLEFADNAKLSFGNDNDLEIYHFPTGGYNVLLNKIGDFLISNTADDKDVIINTDDGSGGPANYIRAKGSTGEVLLYHYGSEKLSTKSTGVDITGVLTTDGATHDGDVTFTGANYNVVWDKSANYLRFTDDARASFGTSDDLTISHNSSTGNTFVVNSTGDFVITNDANDKDIRLVTDDESGGTTNYILCDGSTGNVYLYHYGSEKLHTQSSGVRIVGNALVTGGQLELGPGNDTTLTRESGGVVAIEGNTIVTTGNADVAATTTSSSDVDHVLINDGGVLKKITVANLGTATVDDATALAIALG